MVAVKAPAYFRRKLSHVIEPTGGPGVELATLEFFGGCPPGAVSYNQFIKHIAGPQGSGPRVLWRKPADPRSGESARGVLVNEILTKYRSHTELSQSEANPKGGSGDENHRFSANIDEPNSRLASAEGQRVSV
jgi:hypothetical protein